MTPAWKDFKDTAMSSKWQQNDIKMSKNGTKMTPKWKSRHQNEMKMTPKWHQNDTKFKVSQDTKMTSKWYQKWH